MMMATSDTRRPIPENNATAMNWLRSDFSEEPAAEGEIVAGIRAAFDMTGSPIHKQSEIPTPGDVWRAATKVQRNSCRIGKYGGGQGNRAARVRSDFHQIALIGLRMLAAGFRPCSSQQGPLGPKARTALPGPPVIGRWRYRGAAESGTEATPAPCRLSDAAPLHDRFRLLRSRRC